MKELFDLLLIIGLAVWCWHAHYRINRVERNMHEMARALIDLGWRPRE